MLVLTGGLSKHGLANGGETRCSRGNSRTISPGCQELQYEGHTEARAHVILLVVQTEREPPEGGARDVEVDVCHTRIHELLEEQRGRTRTGVGHTGEVADVRATLALQKWHEPAVERHRMHILTGRLRGIFEMLHEIETPCGGIGVECRDGTECDHLCTGQGREVNDDLGALVLSVGESVGQNEPAFCVGVADLNRLAGHGGVDVAALVGVCACHIVRDRHDAVYHDAIGIEARERFHDAKACRRASHVDAHVAHVPGHLDVQAAGIEAHPFAENPDLGESLVGAGFRSIGQVDESGLMIFMVPAALVDRQDEIGVHLFQLLPIMDLTIHTTRRDVACHTAHKTRGDLVSTTANKVTHRGDRVCDLGRPVNETLLCSFVVSDVSLWNRRRECVFMGRRLLGLTSELVVTEQKSHVHIVQGGDIPLGHEHGGVHDLQPLRSFGHQGGGRLRGFDREGIGRINGFAETDEDVANRAVSRPLSVEIVLGTGEAGLGEGVGHEPEPRRQRSTFVDRHNDRVRGQIAMVGSSFRRNRTNRERHDEPLQCCPIQRSGSGEGVFNYFNTICPIPPSSTIKNVTQLKQYSAKKSTAKRE